ncbi:T-complex protein 11-domain-containing protein [Baffinella frigidus]|nr:T-complex protein 11-domain-containing protein [Cryptophyta sp. CCMP2293]
MDESGGGAVALQVHQPRFSRGIAVIYVQRWYTRLVARQGMERVSIAIAKGMVFADLSLKLRDTGLIKFMKVILHRVCVLTAEGVRSAPGAEVTKTVNVRVFLAAYMIAYHQTNVFESINDRERELHTASVKMLEVFDTVTRAIAVSKPGRDTRQAVQTALTFPGVLHTYLKAFQAWKLPDEAKLTDRIKHALTALYQAEDHLVEGDPDTPKLREEFRAQQERLRAKLLQIAGEDAVKALDHLRASQNEAQACAPIPVAVALGAAAAEHSANGGGYNALPRRMTNDQLAHELLLDPKFTLDEHGGCRGENPVHAKIRKSFHDAFWKSLSDDLRLTPPCYVRVLRVLEEVRDNINDMATGGGAWSGAAQIVDVLDIDLIKQQLEHGAFTWETCCKLVHDVEAILNQFPGGGAAAASAVASEDPYKKKPWDEVKDALEEAGKIGKATDAAPDPYVVQLSSKATAFCNAIAFLLDRTKAVRIEVANSRLRLISPVIKNHGVKYESDHFSKKLREGQLTLMCVRKWLRDNMHKLLHANRLSFKDITSNETKATSFMTVINTGIVALLTGATPTRVAACPETFLLDVTRMAGMHETFRLHVTTACVLILIAQRLGDLRVKNSSQILDAIGNAILKACPRARDLEIITTLAMAQIPSGTMSDENRTMMSAVLVKGIEPSRPVPKLMESRLCAVMLHSLEKDGATTLFKDDDTTVQQFKDFRLPQALRMLAPFIRASYLKLHKVVHLNIKVHAVHYNHIIAAEALGFKPWRCSIAADEAAPAGCRLMTTKEAQDRLVELTNKNLGEKTVRLRNGRIEKVEEETASTDTEKPPKLPWRVVEGTPEGTEIEAMVLPLSVDLVNLTPSQAPPAGFRLMTTPEVKARRWCNLGEYLQEWSIVRFDGGKVSGHGYGGVYSFGDFTAAPYIGEAFVVPLE